MRKKNPLEELELFKRIRADTISNLWKNGRIENFSKGCVIIRSKEPLKLIYIQLSGKSIIYNLTHTGKRKIIFIFGAGTLLNEHVLDSHNASLFCETIESSQLFVISSFYFLSCMSQDFELTKAILEAQERKMWRMGHQLKNTMGSIYMERKLAAKLWKLSRDFGKSVPEGIEINIHLPITFLADMLGAPRENTSRLCKALMERKLIQIKKKRIIILSPERLSHFYKNGE